MKQGKAYLWLILSLVVMLMALLLLATCAAPAPTMVKRIDVWHENMDADADDELVVRFALNNDRGKVVTANGKVTYNFFYSPQNLEGEIAILTLEKQISDKKSDLPIYFDREYFQVTCPTCKGTGYVPCSVCRETGTVECWRCDGTGSTGFGILCSVCGGTGQVKCPKCDGTGQHRCPDLNCKDGILDLSGKTVSLIIEFEREDRVTLQGRCNSALVP